MTKSRYDAARFDDLARRLMDVACDLKGLARTVSDEGLEEFALHDRKPREWLSKLEDWTIKARGKLKDAALREIGAELARGVLQKEREQETAQTARKRRRRGAAGDHKK
jgi:hypothetical protein